TAKAKVSQSRIQKAIPYFRALAEIAGQARKAGTGPQKGERKGAGSEAADESEALHPLLETRDVKKVTILVVAANRGLCGGYNGNVIRFARRRRDELMGQKLEVKLLAVGKKVVNGLKFLGLAFEPVQ